MGFTVRRYVGDCDIQFFPTLLGRVLYFCSFVSFVLFLYPNLNYFPANFALTLAIQVGLPIGYSLFTVFLTLVLAMATLRRKRFVIWLLLFHLGITFISNILSVLIDWTDSLSLVIDALGLFFCPLFFFLLYHYRNLFPGRLSLRYVFKSLLIFILGISGTFVFGFLVADAIRPDMSTYMISRWVLARIIGQDLLYYGTDTDVINYGPNALGISVSILAAVVLILSILVLLRANRTMAMSREENLEIRRLLAHSPVDSLGYYATRLDRSVVFSPSGKAGVSYAISSGAALAASDPIGDRDEWEAAIEEWLKLCFSYGLAPGVLSASEEGARAYRKFGFQIHQMGDEAVVECANFDLNSKNMRDLAIAVRRVRRSGIDIQVRRLADIPLSEVEELRVAAASYRQGEERGFTMSLDRIMEFEDSSTVIVTARKEGELQALLTFVPWGLHCLSLNLMRRNPSSVNGVVEAMIVALIHYSADRGIEKISLNFAMFRQAFVLGQAVDAGWTKRLLLFAMRLGSRFWQLESLYESNARYSPIWIPRYIGYLHASQSASVLLAAGRLEGFLPIFEFERPQSRQWAVDETFLEEIEEIGLIEASSLISSRKLTPAQQSRYRKAEELFKRGYDIYPPGSGTGDSLKKIQELAEGFSTGSWGEEKYILQGRIRRIRDHGGIVFYDLVVGADKLQLILENRTLGETFTDIHLLDLGDLIEVDGYLGRADLGEPSLWVVSWRLLSKSLRPLPPYGVALEVGESRSNRTAHFLQSPQALELLQNRSRAVAAIRQALWQEGYLEVETPILHPVKGGANARPFVTRLNAYSTDVFLRIAPELYLKRLAVAGMDAIFELGRSFRNEGADATHNPEFTSLEAYRAGADYNDMRVLTETLIKTAARSMYGKEICLRPSDQAGCEGEKEEIDISAPWRVVPVLEAVSTALGEEITTATSSERLREICCERGITPPPGADFGYLVTEIYDELVESNTVEPTFYTDFPVSTSPLTRRSRTNPNLAERWDLVAFGMELGTAYTELADPRDQRLRFTEQSLAATAGDPEAMSIDEAFLSALEYGMAPTGGLGLGIDRVIMFLTGTDIRQTLTFPFVRGK
ncbi:bifunctional lysylphosphatidylglycerol synthetase/lysine--tRNA ligase LysX [Actinomycetaceae bacterium TAE3-ERU4]|nr:bifunctional lysylphosphatidylglycerol synthetase/lysine--tRNA ligase LysX [Actinomycetaceae bacterium TAE3-ERU4]